jgi:hypothetical protein
MFATNKTATVQQEQRVSMSEELLGVLQQAYLPKQPFRVLCCKAVCMDGQRIGRKIGKTRIGPDLRGIVLAIGIDITGCSDNR